MLISGSSVKTPTLNLIKFTRERSAGISIIGNDLRNVKNLCSPSEDPEDILFFSSNRMR